MIKRILDNTLDATVLGGFSRVGYALRSRSFQKLSSYDLSGETIVLTGPTSGLGRATALQLRAMNANLVLVARNMDKLQKLHDELGRIEGTGSISLLEAEMGNIASVVSATRTIASQHPAIDVLVHNAGALLAQREVASCGVEQTIASHVLGPFVMTALLLPQLRAARGRVVTVSSGGMYAATLQHRESGQSFEMSDSSYDGTRQYAIAKRAQVTLNEMWAERETGVDFQAMHPGWADTPGVETSLPTFRKVMRPLLRTAEEGADTIVWLCAERNLPSPSGSFWCDRMPRPIHRLPNTKRSDTSAARAALWDWCQEFIPPSQ